MLNDDLLLLASKPVAVPNVLKHLQQSQRADVNLFCCIDGVM